MGNDSWDGLNATYGPVTGSGPKLSIKNATDIVNPNGIINIADGTYTGDNNIILITKHMTFPGQSQAGTIIDAQNQGYIFFIGSGVTVNLHNLTLTNGKAAFGGAICNLGTDSICTLTNCTLSNNTANYGGAIYNSGTCTVTNCTFTNNTATNQGGAIYNSGTCTVTNCTLANNTANRNGGAICNLGMCTANFNRFYNNTATIEGNAIYLQSGSVDAENSWWGTNHPETNWSSLISGFAAPVWWIYMNLTANTTNPLYGDTVNLTANFNYHYNGTEITPLTGGHIPNSVVIFTSNDGTLNPLSKTTVEGLANSIFTPTKAGSVTVNATLDNQICSLTFNVKTPTNLTVNSLSGNKGKTVTLNAVLKDYYGTPLNSKTVEFYVNNVKVGENSTDVNGLAVFNYNITQISGIYNITAKFLETSDI